MDDTPHSDATADGREVPPAERHAARSALYSAAAGVFCYPDDDLVADLTHEGTAEGLREAGRKLDLEAEVETLVGALGETTRDDLESAYNDLFGLPGADGSYPVVPYEAEYTVGDEVGRQQRRIATVVGLLEAFGVEPADRFDERQDHVVVELELVQVLAARRAVAREEGDDDTAANLERAEAMVLEEHLGDFVPAFAHEVRESTPDPSEVLGADEDDADRREAAAAVYRAAADLAESVVTRDVATHPEPDVDFDAASEVKSRA
ncbi:molecular chaperone TorD family protein [Halorussus gelatinilyticus]|uniref:Molecular chaperone TorD family protein n=1 Tax=Halorussus gelatinilyticus TaxID=2937524 RepID=A0A8U0ILB2_9EURY|nr:molecular chaperone TorD family protein [Halorussus gelatinilyticus]UPW01401.1 molecular chaperone TorD family protein [Halorussus gelatinilyticus]